MREGLSKELGSMSPEGENPIFVTLCASRGAEQRLTVGDYFFDYAVNEDANGIQKINSKDLPPKIPGELVEDYLQRISVDERVIKMAESIGDNYGRPVILHVERKKTDTRFSQA